MPGRPAACSSRTAVVTSGEEGWARRALTWASSPPPVLSAAPGAAIIERLGLDRTIRMLGVTFPAPWAWPRSS